MSAISKQPPKTAAQTRKWEHGVRYRCVLSKSNAYRYGRAYECYTNGKGISCLRGDDGLDDLCSNLISGFVKSDIYVV